MPPSGTGRAGCGERGREPPLFFAYWLASAWIGSKTPTAGWRAMSSDMRVRSTERRRSRRRKPSLVAFWGLLLGIMPLRAGGVTRGKGPLRRLGLGPLGYRLSESPSLARGADLRGAEGTARRLERHVREAIGARARGRGSSRGLVLHAVDLTDHEEQHEGHDQEVDEAIEEDAVLDDRRAGVDSFVERGVVGGREIEEQVGEVHALQEEAD